MEIIITRYGTRFWAIYLNGQLVAVTVYKTGTLAVQAAFTRLQSQRFSRSLQRLSTLNPDRKLQMNFPPDQREYATFRRDPLGAREVRIVKIFQIKRAFAGNDQAMAIALIVI